MGFTNELQFGPVRLSSLVDWKKGGLGVNLTNDYFYGSGLAKDTALANAQLKRFSQGVDVWLENTGFVKLRELTLSYDLPQAFSQQIFHGRAQAARFELSGRNLATWTKYTGLDPEVSNFGNQALGRFQDVTPYPPMKTFFVSVGATF
jgi:hypothetical protein